MAKYENMLTIETIKNTLMKIFRIAILVCCQKTILKLTLFKYDSVFSVNSM